MTMTSKLHLIKGNAVKVWCSIWDDLEALFQTCWFTLEITTTNKEDLVIDILAVCKVVSKIVRNVNTSLVYDFSCNIVLVNSL